MDGVQSAAGDGRLLCLIDEEGKLKCSGYLHGLNAANLGCDPYFVSGWCTMRLAGRSAVMCALVWLVACAPPDFGVAPPCSDTDCGAGLVCHQGAVWCAHDGVLDEGERCDDGTMTAPRRCGSGVVRRAWPGSPGKMTATRATTDACLNLQRSGLRRRLAAHGLAGEEGFESCDDGNRVDGDGCCQVNTCGDGIVHEGVEACDDGNRNDLDDCTNACTLASCGDGLVEAGVEACDDGNDVETDACLNTCQLARCGRRRDPFGFGT